MSTNIKVQRICLYCENEFTARTTSTKYCSHKCNSRHYKQRLKGIKIEKSNTETRKIKTFDFDSLKAKEFLSIRDVSLLLGCSTRTVYRLISSGTINCVNLSERLTRVKRAEINRILEPAPLKSKKPQQLNDFKISECYTISEVQDKFGISQSGLRLLIKKHNIQKKQRGKFTYVSKLVINQLLT